MIPPEPTQDNFAKLPSFPQKFDRLSFRNLARSIIAGKISLATAMIKIVGDFLKLLTKQLGQHAESSPVVTLPDCTIPRRSQYDRGELECCLIGRLEAQVYRNRFDGSIFEIAIRDMQ